MRSEPIGNLYLHDSNELTIKLAELMARLISLPNGPSSLKALEVYIIQK